jgi:hypothetical protein
MRTPFLRAYRAAHHGSVYRIAHLLLLSDILATIAAPEAASSLNRVSASGGHDIPSLDELRAVSIAVHRAKQPTSSAIAGLGSA